MAEGRRPGGKILGLLDLIEERRGALEYDFRTRFQGVAGGLAAIPDQMGWGEAVRLIEILRADPSTMLASSMEGWDYPLARTDAILMDQYDLARAAAGDKKWKGYARPFKTDARSKTHKGNVGERSTAQVYEILARAGHTPPI